MFNLKLEEVRPAVAAMLTHGALLGRLAHVEWAAEKLRLKRLFALSLIAVVMTIVLLFTISIVVLALAWDTDYRWPVALGLIIVYAAGLALAVRRMTKLAIISEHPFSGTREELAADFQLIKQKLSHEP
jgi:uncharacterized membrane protein YqjE